MGDNKENIESCREIFLEIKINVCVVRVAHSALRPPRNVRIRAYCMSAINSLWGKN